MAKRQDGSNTPPTRRAEGPTGAKIEFFCPNGHRIRADASLAGKSGPCSKCGVRVTIPSVSTPSEETAAASEATPTPSESMAGPMVAPAEPPWTQVNPLVFDVPVASPTEVPLQPPFVEGTADLPGTGVIDVPVPEAVDVAAEPPVIVPGAPIDEFQPPPVAGDFFGVQMAGNSADASWHPSADLVARLWAEREHGGVVEVHHADGVIVPTWYDVAWSRGTHGVFGSQAADGTVTITALAWDAVKKVVVRGVKTLPADMFPG